jgi:DNA polymerase I-like protein with 3'-5' exonuclease and polymerase domains
LKGVAYLRNIVHDSILAECRREDAEYVAGVLDRCMVESARTIVGDYVAFATDYKVGTNWGEV